VSSAQELNARLGELRAAFDHSFSHAVDETRTAQFDFLSIRVAGDPYALSLSEVASLHLGRRLVRAPSLLPELLGIAGFRGVLTPAYDLSRLLGYASEAGAKWLVVAHWPSPIAFAFETFEAHRRVAADRVSDAARAANSAVRGAVQDGQNAVPLLHLPSLVEGIANRIKALGPSQER
jgi:chemotaxis signal transduction protein